MMKRILPILFTLLLGRPCVVAYDRLPVYTQITTADGLPGNRILYLTQLRDGRMVIVTDKHLTLYDGDRFRSYPMEQTRPLSLVGYRGATHVYDDGKERLWIKDFRRAYCFNLRTGSFVDRPDTLLHLPEGEVKDLFWDSTHRAWIVTDRGLWSERFRRYIDKQAANGELQDVVSAGGRTYLFYADGTVKGIGATGGQEFTCRAYGEAEAALYSNHSLVVDGHDGWLYQLRNGRRGILLRFDTRSHRWQTLMESPTVLHTLFVNTPTEAWVSCKEGFWQLNPVSGERTLHHYLPVNTIFGDRDGGVWLGSYAQGLFYTHPLRHPLLRSDIDGITLFHPDDRQIPLQHFRPLLTRMEQNGREWPLPSGQEGVVRFSHRENSPSFTFSALHFALPQFTYYRYRLHREAGWQSVKADPQGLLHLHFVGLPPGDYTLEVSASTKTDAAPRTPTLLRFTIAPPWWQTPYAYVAYGLSAIALLLSGNRLYLHRKHKQMEQRHREEMMMVRIRDLVEQLSQYEQQEAAEATVKEEAPAPAMSEADRDFLNRAISLVEAHIGVNGYTVEQLSRDLCMERTGLYKKISALMDQSPSLFIRSIRLHRAAEMIAEGKCSISEIAMRTGFSSASYMSRCFQEEYGCKPSEYAGKGRKST